MLVYQMVKHIYACVCIVWGTFIIVNQSEQKLPRSSHAIIALPLVPVSVTVVKGKNTNRDMGQERKVPQWELTFMYETHAFSIHKIPCGEKNNYIINDM